MDLKTESKENLQARLKVLGDEAAVIRQELFDRGLADSQQLEQAVRDMYKVRGHVETVKFYRAQTGLGLKESYDAVKGIMQ